MLLSAWSAAAWAQAILDQGHYRWRNDDGGEGGSAPIEVTATADATTSSTSDVVVSGMTATPGAGDYLVWFTTSVENTSGGNEQWVSIYLDGAQIAHSERQITEESSTPDTAYPVATQALVTGVTAGQTLSVRWRTTGGTATMHERTLLVQAIDPADVAEASATVDTTTSSGTDAVVAAMTLTPGDGDYLAWFSASLEGDSADTTQFVSLYVNGVQVADSERRIFSESSIAGASLGMALAARLTGLGATDTVDVRWRTTGGTATMHQRSLVLQRLAASETASASSSTADTTSSATDVVMSAMAVTPGAGNHLVWFTGSLENDATGTQFVSIYVNGTQIAASERRFYTEDSIPDTAATIATQALLEGLGAADTVEVRWRTESGTATVYERALVVGRASGAGATPAADEDTALVDLSKGATRRLRFAVSNEGTSSSGPVSYQLQEAEAASCTTASWTTVPTDGSGHWQIVDSAFLTDGEPTLNLTSMLTDEASTFVTGELRDASNVTGGISLGADEHTEIEFSLQATSNATDGGHYCFRLFDSAAGTPLDNYTAYGEATLEAVDLAIVKADSADPVLTSAAYSYSLDVSNQGAMTATGVEVTDLLPAGVVYVGASGTGWSCSEAGGTVTCTRASLAGSSAAPTITVDVTAPGTPGAVVNNASVAADQTDVDPSDDSDAETTTVQDAASSIDLDQTHYRWRNDDGAEGGAVPLEASATSSTSTSSGADVLVPGMAITPRAGDYLVWFSGSLEGDSGGSDQFVSIYLDGVQVPHTERIQSTDGSTPDTPLPISTGARLVGVADGQTIEARWRTTAGSATVWERSLVVQPVDAAESFQASAITDTTTSSTSDVLLDSMTTSPGAGEYLAWFSGSVENDSADQTLFASFYVNGVQVGDSERRFFNESSIAGSSYVVSLSARLTGVGAGDAVEVRWRTTGGTSTMHRRTMVLERISAADSSEVSASATSSTTSTTDVTMAGMSLTPGAGDYLVWFTASVEGSTESTQQVSLYVNGSQVASTARRIFTEASIPDTAFVMALQAYLTGVGASDVVEVRWRTSAGTATVHGRALTLYRQGSAGASFSLAEDTSLDGAVKGSLYRLRLQVSNEGLFGSAGVAYQLQVAEADNCATGIYAAVPTDASGHWQVADSAFFVDGAPTENISPGLTDEGTTFVVGALHDASNTSGAIALDVGEFTELELAVRPTSNATDGGHYCFRLWDATSGSPLDTYTRYGEADLAGVDLSISKSDSADPVLINTAFSYTLAVSNLGAVDAANLVVTDTLPSVTFQSASGTGWSCSHTAGTVTCTRAALAAGQTAPDITINVFSPGASSVLDNTATVSSDGQDENPDDNSASEQTSVADSSDEADLGIVDIGTPNPVLAGQSLRYELRVTNFGPFPATAVTVTDVLPSGVTFQSASGTGWSCSEAGGTVTCSYGGLLAVGPAPEIAVQLAAPASAGSINNSAAVSHLGFDSYAANDQDSEPTLVIDPSADPELCYAVADSSDSLISVTHNAPHVLTEIGETGVGGIESVVLIPDDAGNWTLYAVQDQLRDGSGTQGMFGTLDRSTGAFSAIGPVGTVGDGTYEVLANDVDGLAIHPQTGDLWGQLRNDAWPFPGDVLIKIDPATGSHVPDVFGPGVDFLKMDYTGALGGAACLETDMDDLAISDDGRWFSQIDNSGANQQLAELEIVDGMPTGRFLTCRTLVDANGDIVEDMEGTGFDTHGTFWGTTGNSGNTNSLGEDNSSRLWIIDYENAIALHPSGGGLAGLPLIDEDHEGSDCRFTPYSALNRIYGTVFFDENSDGLGHPTEPGWSGVTVRLYFDQNADGSVDAGDVLIRTTVSDASGSFSFTTLASGPFVLDVDPSTLPASTALTTDNLEAAVLSVAGTYDPQNDFGFQSTTLALVSRLDVGEVDGIPVVEFETASEVGTLGFYLLRWGRSDNQWQLAHEGLIPSPGSPQGGLYRVPVDAWPGPGGEYYSLVEVEVSGRERSHGPFLGELVDIQRVRDERQAPLVSNRAVAEARRPDPRAAERLERATRQAAREAASEGGGPPWAWPQEPVDAVALAVPADGLYFVDAETLSPLFGSHPSLVRGALAQGRLELTNRGEEVAWLGAPDETGLYFVGEGPAEIFSSENVYFLRASTGRRAESFDGRPWSSLPIDDFVDTARFEEQNFAGTVASTRGDQDFWYWSPLAAGHPKWGTVSFPLTLPDSTVAAEPGELRAFLLGATSTSVAGEHHVAISVNGVFLGEESWGGRGRRQVDLYVPAGVLLPGENRLEVTALLDSGAPQSVLYVDAFELDSRRRLEAEGDRLHFRVDSVGTVEVRGFTAPDVLVVDVTDPRRMRIAQGVETLAGAGYSVRFEADHAGQEFIATTRSAVRLPSSTRVRHVDPLPRLRELSGAEYVVLAPRQLLEGAEALAGSRDRRGLSTVVIDVQDVYDVFNHGNVSPIAIRDFLDQAWREWPIRPRYAVLVGAGHFDYRGYGATEPNLIPPLLKALDGNGLFATDLTLGDLVGADGVPEVVVGRIPVRTSGELLRYLEKLESFEAGGGFGSVVLSADNPDDVGDYPQDSDRLGWMVPRSRRLARVYLSELPLDEARLTLADELAGSAYWLNYVGHAGVDRLAAEGLLTTADIPGLTGSPAVVTAVACVLGRFELPGFPSLAEELLLHPAGGAVAVFSPTGLSVNRQAALLDEALFRAAFVEGAPTLGEAVVRALTETVGRFSAERPFETFNILGDPALALW